MVFAKRFNAGGEQVEQLANILASMSQSAASADASASAEGGSARGSADASGNIEMAEPGVPPAAGGEER
eukprot:3319394-Alexandrium_andersonii.AAC.1